MTKFLFQARTRMLELRANFKQKYLWTGVDCELGGMEEETQEHILSCDKIPDSSLTYEIPPKHEDLLSTDVEKQLRISAVMKEKMLKRDEKLKEELTNN